MKSQISSIVMSKYFILKNKIFVKVIRYKIKERELLNDQAKKATSTKQTTQKKNWEK